VVINGDRGGMGSVNRNRIGTVPQPFTFVKCIRISLNLGAMRGHSKKGEKGGTF